MILYLAGPMTGLPAFHFPAFHRAAAHLRDSGYTVLNPADNPNPDGAPWDACMRLALAQLVTADAVALLPGWQHSRGARLEALIARALLMPFFDAETFAPIPTLDVTAALAP